MMEKTIRRMFGVFMMALMLMVLSSTALAEPVVVGTEVGQTMPDFTVSLTDGTTATLSELLEEKDLVVLNIFATWCGPCESEFPEMEKTYQAHKNQMELISVSGDPEDTMQMVADYKASHGLSFLMGIAEDNLSFIDFPAYPTTYFITRDGIVGYARVGSFMTEGDFEAKVSYFLSPDYDGQPLDAEGFDEDYEGDILLTVAAITLGVNGLLFLLTAIGRFFIFRKAGVSGWQAFVPFLSAFKEYDLAWNGWLGLLGIALRAGFWIVWGLWLPVPMAILGLATFAILLLESLKLAKAFGKGTVAGILLTLLPDIARIVLGLSKAQYQGKGATA